MKQKYNQEIYEKWGKTEAYNEYSIKTKNYDDDKWNSLSEKMNKIFTQFSMFKRSNKGFDDIEVQNLVNELKDFISKNYYNCTDSMLLNLGQMYVDDERFTSNIDKDVHGTAEYVNKAIEFYYRKNN